MFIKNTAGQFIHFQGVDAATGGIKSAVTWTVRRCIDGTFAAATGTVTEDGTTGWYKFAMSQADTNGNNIGFNFTGTGAVPQTVNIVTTSLNPYDAVRFGMTALPNANAGAAGGLWILGANAAATTTLTGVAAAGATPATPALSLTGGAASITGGGVAAQALLATGGAGAASTNGAAEGVKMIGGGTNTVASSAHGLNVTGTSVGSGLGATSGGGATGNGITATAASTNGSGITGVKTGSGSDLNCTVTPLTLAKTTNITGFNDIAATAIVSSGAITTLAGAVVNVDLVDTLTTYTGNTPQTGDSFARIGAAGVGLTAVALADATSDAVIADAVWNAATATYGAAGSYGLLIETDLDATISSRLATAGYTAPPSAATIASAVWDLDATAHQTQGTFGQAIGDPGADTDTIWALVNANLDAAVSSRLSAAGYTAPDNVTIGLIAGYTDSIESRLPAALVGGKMDATLDATERGAVADKLLGRTIAGAADGGRTVKDALRALRNKVAIVAGVMTVYAEDDVTPAYTAAVTTAAGNPIDSIDPV